MFQESELFNLLQALIAVVILLFYFKEEDIPPLSFMTGGFFAIVTAMVFTVVEGVVLHDIFNILEHLCYTLAGILFAIAGFRLLKKHQEETG